MGLFSHRGGAPGSDVPQTPVNVPHAQLQRGTGTEVHLELKNAHDARQLKVFTRWWNSELPAGSVGLGNNGLANGVAAAVAPLELLQALTQEPFPKFSKDTQGNKIQRLQNLHMFMERVRAIGVNVTNIGEEDLADGNQKLIMGLTWKLITHFSDGMLTEAGGSELLSWVANNNTSKADMTSWTESFGDGVALCGLLQAYDPSCIDLETVRPGGTTVELAFKVAYERFGAPKLLDPSDLTGDDVDARSVQTYVVRLRQALRNHAEKKRSELGLQVPTLEADGDKIAAWAGSAVKELTSNLADITGREQRAETPDQRTAVMIDADRMHGELEGTFRKMQKAQQEAVKKTLADTVGEMLEALERERRSKFDHGGPLPEISTAPADPAHPERNGSISDRLKQTLTRVEQAWKAMEEKEKEYEEFLFSLLEFKKTDMMLAEAEKAIAELGSWAGAQVGLLQAALLENYDSIARNVESTTTLGEWASDIDARAPVESTLRELLEEITKRREDEERAPIEPAGLAELDASWKEMMETATKLRRCVGAAAKWQDEQGRVVIEQWHTMQGLLSSNLEADEELTAPESKGSCAVM